MNVFVSYAFNDDNRWIEELAIPLIKSLGFDVIVGRRMEGEIIAEGVEARIKECRGCIGFTTRRTALGNGKFSTHQWVLDELTTARTLKLTVIEAREDDVVVEGANTQFVQLRYSRDKRDRFLVDLAEALARWPARQIRIQLVPPGPGTNEFAARVLADDAQCAYTVKRGNRIVAQGTAVIQPIQPGGFFVDIEVPDDDALVQVEVKKANAGSWKSYGSGVKAIPIHLIDV